jgi:hypothetical protein
VAPVVLAVAAGGAVIDRQFGNPRRVPEPSRDRLRSASRAPSARNGAARRLALAAAVAAAATLATPVGAGLFRYLRLHLVLPALHPIDEFRSPTWISDAPLFVYVAAVAAVLVAAWAAARQRAPSAALDGPRALFTRLAPPVVLALLTVGSVRFAADLALAAAPLLAVGLTALGARARGRTAAWLAGPTPSLLAGALLGAAAIGPRLTGAVPAGIGLDRRELPLAAIAFVDDNGLRDRMYNDFEIGSYLIFDRAGGFPRHRVFVDPRLPAYPEEMHRLLGRFDLSRDEWTAAMDRYGVETALLAYAGINRRVSWWDPQRWALVYREGDARVFVRRLPRHRSIIAAREVPATFAFTVEEGTATIPLVERPAASPVADCEWQRRVGDLLFELDGAASPRARAAYDRALAAPAGCLAAADEARLAAWLGAVALGAGRDAEALLLLDRARDRGDADVTTLSNRALALERLGRPEEAAAAWAEVATRAADPQLRARALDRQRRLGPR